MTPDAEIRSSEPRRPTRDDFAEAKAGYASGYGVDHIVVSEWLRTWGHPGQIPFAEWLAQQDG
jgi:hypothetical protein